MSLVSRKNNIPTQALLGLVFLLAIQPACSIQRRATAKHPKSSQIKPWSLATSGIYQAVAVGDLNGDQHKDIIGGSSVPGTVAIWYGNGRGAWSFPTFLPVKGDVRSIALADFDTDGRPDLAFSIQGDNPGIQVWMNGGQEGWEKGKSPDDVGNFNGIRAEEINGDGNPDLIAAAEGINGKGGIRVWLGDGRGGWGREVGPTSRDEYIDVAVADFNEDGHLDIGGSSIRPNGAIRVWLGDSEGGWSELDPLELGNFYALTIGDLNRDGHIDLYAGTYQNGLRVFLGDGRGGFARLSPPVSKGSFWKVISGEVDAGGGQELFASSMDSRGILVWQWQNGSLSRLSESYGSSGTYYDMVLSDLDSDVQQDLVAASDGQGVSIWAKQAQTRSFAAVSFSGFGASYTHEKEQVFPINPEENDVFVTIDGRAQYKIGPEDLLEISLWKGVEETKYLVPVRSDGMITFTFLEDIKVAGLTTQQVDDLLTAELGHYIRHPRVTVAVKEYNSKFVSLLGAISTTGGVIYGPDTPRGSRTGPGSYALTGKTTVLQVLARAGGPTDQANLRQVSIRRETGQAFTVNINKVITQGDLSQNIVLDAGDTVLVPPVAEDPRNRVFVFGEVKNPGVFPTRGDITVMEAIALSGGFQQRAVLGDAKILRGDMTRPEVIACDLNRLLKRGDISQNIKLHNGDVLYIPKNTIGRISDFLREIQPILDFILYPARVWDGYKGEAPFN